VEGSSEPGGHDDVVDAVAGVITCQATREDKPEWSLIRWGAGEVRDAMERLGGREDQGRRTPGGARFR